MSKSNLNNYLRHTQTIMLINELEQICDKDMKDEYKVLLIKGKINLWRKYEN